MIIENIETQLGLDRGYIAKVASTASHRYKIYGIPKRTGGIRTISHPSREVKLLQGWVVDNILSRLPVHEAAAAYRRGASIRKHALIHCEQNYLLKVDFENFFPSLRNVDVERVLAGGALGAELNALDIDFVTRIVCRNGALAIGAPSSPALANAVMFEFDVHWQRESLTRGVRYSRYADDLCFSTNHPGVLEGVLQDLRADLEGRPSPKLRINDAKTVFTSRKRKRLVTGLILTADRKVSLGRRCKRRIKSLLHRANVGALPENQKTYLRGFIAYANSVEPTFVASLARKYGEGVFDSLRNARN